MRVWSGTAKEFTKAGRFRLIEEMDVFVINGKPTLVKQAREAVEARRPLKQSALDGILVVWEEKRQN